METENIIYVNYESLITIKSGSRFPKNIADFMPDYNLWFALKFMSPGKIIIVSNLDLIKYKLDWLEYETRLRFIQIWLRQMTEISNISYVFSINGNWLTHLDREENNNNILDKGLRYNEKSWKKTFIDTDNLGFREYITSRSEFSYISKSDFIMKYNSNPRVYEKKNNVKNSDIKT